MWRYNTTFLTGISPLIPGSSYFLLRPTIPFFLYPPLLACGAGSDGSNNSLSELFGELFPNCSGNCFCSGSGIVSQIVFGSGCCSTSGSTTVVGCTYVTSWICRSWYSCTGTAISGSVTGSAGGRTFVFGGSDLRGGNIHIGAGGAMIIFGCSGS